MDKQFTFIGELSDDEKLVIARAKDLIKRAHTRSITTYTPFLNPGEQHLILHSGLKTNEIFINSYGGYENAERRIISFSPFCNSDETLYPIGKLKIVSKDKSVFSHKDYLGSILSLGIKREKTGDICIFDDYAIVFCENDVLDFLINNLSKIRNSNVMLEKYNDEVVVSDEKRFKTYTDTVSSMRLDCVVGAFIKKSRAISTNLILSGMVNVNYRPLIKATKLIENGDTISVRGFGKAVILTDQTLTKKGRVHITIKQYI